MRGFLLFILFLLCSIWVYSEGTRELKPGSASNIEGALNPWDWGGDFASYTSDPNTRLNIRIVDYNNERIYFGFNSQYGGATYVRIKDAAGNIVYGPTQIVMSGGQSGYIRDYNEAVAGPNVVDPNGYIPLSYQPTSNGDHYIELNTDNPNTIVQRNVRYSYFDVSVVNTNTISQLPGRVWAKKWALSTFGTNNIFQPTMYIMRDDGVIYQIVYNDIRPFGFGIISNSWGLSQALSLEDSRKSDGTSYSQGTVPYEPEHKIFLNQPDPSAFTYATEIPQVELTSITNISCDENGYCIEIYASEEGQVELEIDVNQNGFIYGSNDVYLLESVAPGTQCVYWDGLDNSGSPVGNGAQITMEYTYEAGIIHFPIYDAEQNSGGFSVNLIAPTVSVNKAQFWDDSAIGGTVELDGCTSNPCHTWTGSNEEFHNTWARSFAYASDTTFAFNANCPPVSKDAAVETEQNIDYFFNSGDFYFGDYNAGDVLDHVLIATLPASGTLYFDSNSNGSFNAGEAVQANDQITAATISQLAFSPVNGQYGIPYTSFTFKVSDGTLYSDDAYTLTINVDCGDITGSGSITANNPPEPVFANETQTASNENNTGNGTDWTTGSTNNNDNQFTDVTLYRNADSKNLDLTGFNFNIPSGASINGIEVTFSSYYANNWGTVAISDQDLSLLNGSVVLQDKSTGTVWPSSETETTLGGSTDLWGQTTNFWNNFNFSNIGFRIKIRGSNSGGRWDNSTAYIDYLGITVYYTSSGSYCDTETASFTVSGYSGVNSYDWSVPTGSSIISGQGSNTVTIDFNNAGQNGDYQLCVTPANDCKTGIQACTTISIIDCLDTDNDGVGDEIDLDDDNDGITDCAEKGLDLLTVGSAFVISGNGSALSSTEIELTPEANYQKGTAMYINQIDLNENFTFNFDAYLGDKDGADGTAIIFHNDPAGINAIGADGEGMGANGIANGLVLELDTYQNGNQGDPADDHGCIWESDNIGNRLSSPLSLGNLEDGNWHNVVVSWSATSKTLSYTVDGIPAGSYTNSNMINAFFNGSNLVYFGFSAATGALNNSHRIRFNNLCDLPAVVDTDGDGIPDQADTDSDNDGCDDVIEAGFTSNGSGQVQGSGVDANGLVTGYSSAYITPNDNDNNGVLDFQQNSPLPSISSHPSNVSIQPGDNAVFNTIASGDTYKWQYQAPPAVPSDPWYDITGGGIYSDFNTPNLLLSNVSSTYTGYRYRLVVSSLANACSTPVISDYATLMVISSDYDNDGIPNDLDLDDDNDGIEDIIEGNADSDYDGILDYLDLDSDNDGIFDITEAGGSDTDNNGLVDAATPFSQSDLNNNGLIDIYDPSCDGIAMTFYAISQSNDGVQNPDNATGAPDNSYADLYPDNGGFSTGLYIDLALGQTVPDGTTITVVLGINQTNDRIAEVSQSINGNTFTNPQTYTSTGGAGIYQDPRSYTLDGDAAYIRIHNVSTGNFWVHVDGLYYNLTPCGGTIGTALADPDTDGDSYADRIDGDSDGDFCPDVTEAGFTDSNFDEYLDGTGYSTKGLVTGNIDGYISPNNNYKNDFGAAPAITSDLVDVTSCQGDNTIFTISSINNDQFLWEYNDGINGWQEASGGLFSNPVPNQLQIANTPSNYNTYQFRVQIWHSNYLCRSISAQAKLTVEQCTVFDSHPADLTICANEGGNLTVSVTAASPNYQWQVLIGTDWIDITPALLPTADISGETSATLLLDNMDDYAGTYQVRCEVTDGAYTENSNTATVTIHPVPSLTTGGVATTLCYNTLTTSLDYTAAGGTPDSYSINWLTGPADQGQTAYTFNAGGGTISNIPVSAATPPGTYQGSMTLYNANGCESTVNIALTIMQFNLVLSPNGASDCPQLSASTTPAFNPENTSYNHGATEVRFRVAPDAGSDYQNGWSFDFDLTGTVIATMNPSNVTVLTPEGDDATAPSRSGTLLSGSINAGNNSYVDLLFQVENTPGSEQLIEISIDNTNNGYGCPETSTANDNEADYTIEAMPEVGAFN